MTNLRFTAMGAALSFNERRPMDKILSDLGITYKKCSRVGSQCWLWGCIGPTKNLPGYIVILDVDPNDFIGHLLTKDEADSYSQN